MCTPTQSSSTATSRSTPPTTPRASRTGRTGSPTTRRCSTGSRRCPGPSGSRTWSSPPPAGTACPRRGRTTRCARRCSPTTGRSARTILERATQTNEAGRLATLVPAFAAAAGSGPIALLEVGASAGLCLYPDRYTFAWTTADDVRRVGAGPELAADVEGPAPLPDRPPVVAWRGGIDLNPLDVTDADQMDWLTMLVWPEHDDRRAQLLRAIDVARAEPPTLVQGDLLEELPALVDAAAEHGPVVVFHSAVIAYLTVDDRARFHDLMTGLVRDGRCHWVSNEAANVLPGLARHRHRPPQIRPASCSASTAAPSRSPTGTVAGCAGCSRAREPRRRAAPARASRSSAFVHLKTCAESAHAEATRTSSDTSGRVRVGGDGSGRR